MPAEEMKSGHLIPRKQERTGVPVPRGKDMAPGLPQSLASLEVHTLQCRWAHAQKDLPVHGQGQTGGGNSQTEISR